MYTSYGDWQCSDSLCSIPIFAIGQHFDVISQSYEFTSWYNEVFTSHFANNRSGSRVGSYYTTPWYNYQSSWGYADSFSGDQHQFVSLGVDSSECWVYGAGSGAHIETAILRNSSGAYTVLALW